MKTLENSISEQQRIFVKQGSLDQNKIGFYMVSLPSDQIATLCVTHLMRHLMSSFVKSTENEAAKAAQTKDFDIDYTSADIKVPAINLFLDLGKLMDKQLKQTMLEKKDKGGKMKEKTEEPLE
jgi:hypothetical protein